MFIFPFLMWCSTLTRATTIRLTHVYFQHETTAKKKRDSRRIKQRKATLSVSSHTQKQNKVDYRKRKGRGKKTQAFSDSAKQKQQ